MLNMNNTELSQSKPLIDSDRIVQSLLNLRDELYSRADRLTLSEREFFWKINSCLYRGYKLKD